MNIVSRIFAIILSAGLLAFIFELVRRNKLKEKDAILWVLTGSVMLILAMSQKLLCGITDLLGIQVPLNGMLFFGIFFIIIINIYFSIAISTLSEQNKKIVQKLALLEKSVRDNETKS